MTKTLTYIVLASKWRQFKNEDKLWELSLENIEKFLEERLAK